MLRSSSLPKPLPRFEGKENCTFTVRIPRFYLSDEEREGVTHRRALWGCDVYTDDSDALAAAIHSGWVQGHWGEDVDASMFELLASESRSGGKLTGVDAHTSEAPSANDASSRSVLTSPPLQPMRPPHSKNLHLTCLVLPPLENYTSKICHGIKSRAWGDNHDGMSFRIEKVEWVDEGVGKAEERSGEGRRKRVKGLLEERKGFGRSLASPAVTIRGGFGGFGGSQRDIVMVGA